LPTRFALPMCRLNETDTDRSLLSNLLLYKTMRNFTISRHRTLKKVLFGVFFLLFCLAASAQAQRKLLSASFTGEPLVEVLRALEKMDQYRFIFNYAELDGYRVTQSFTNVEMNTALSRVLTGLPFEYTIEGIRITVRKTADTPGNAAAVGVRAPVSGIRYGYR